MILLFKLRGNHYDTYSTYVWIGTWVSVLAKCPQNIFNDLDSKERKGSYALSKLELLTDLIGPYRYRLNRVYDVGLLQGQTLDVHFLINDGKEYGPKISFDNLFWLL